MSCGRAVLLLALAGAAQLAFASPLQSRSLHVENLAYRSPLAEFPQHGHDIARIAKRWNDDFEKTVPVFQFGVASGDPTCDSVIIWTRAAPKLACFLPNEVLSAVKSSCECAANYTRNAVGLCVGGPDSIVRNITEDGGPVLVEWQVSESKNFTGKVHSGKVFTSAEVSYSVKVDVPHLKADTVYYYRFVSPFNSSVSSPAGRTRTLPASDVDVTRAWKIAVYSCSNLPQGFFNAYGNVARKDEVDLIVHVGDYIYEYKNGGYGNGSSTGRVPIPWDRDIVELEDYRLRYASYRSDSDLVLSHQIFPWVSVWDDHEVADNSWKDGASNHNSTSQGPYSVRKHNAFRAYYEWMPIRQLEVFGKIWRTLPVGTLFDLIMVDTRHWGRDITDIYTNTAYVKNISTWSNRTLEGFDQEWWIKDTLSASKARGAKWRLLGNQVQFDRLNFSAISTTATGDANYDSWDGYVASRQRLLNRVKDAKIDNLIILSGDIHSNWVHDVRDLNGNAYNSTTGEGALGVEFVGTAVSSPSPFASFGKNQTELATRALVATNPGLQWAEGWTRGYFQLTITNGSVVAEYFALNTTTKTSDEIKSAAFEVKAGANKLTRGYTKSVLGAQKLL
ncbi:hypothetical protein M427DRAFT_144507 [Gonapodya prolifera JEL478]|uniref:PhoD-like phosphatase metallophosphatase domain-containing protein n=1 Tax=Gonapodya prolifera (strain JEL478) TaxID=1344416 RepID=A0A139AJN2_GONPJ|nr:hypothetical protein M427DRAFT_144507 [Gonapodya prolifera JEL478]|eukprot:KXS16918.1 hypothetical protein M427DRAFT_144507 [Gonapodya prolifera JEL478]